MSVRSLIQRSVFIVLLIFSFVIIPFVMECEKNKIELNLKLRESVRSVCESVCKNGKITKAEYEDMYDAVSISGASLYIHYGFYEYGTDNKKYFYVVTQREIQAELEINEEYILKPGACMEIYCIEKNGAETFLCGGYVVK